MPRETDSQLVEREFLTLPVWDQLDAQTAETVARAVERCLPDPWKFLRIERHESGDQKRHVAFFDWDNKVFALIPGSEVTLGYDPARPSELPHELVTDWEQYARSHAGWEQITWVKYLTDVLSPVRTVSMHPFLISTSAKRKAPGPAANFRKLVQSWGMRLPTADEWEHACSAGTRSLWHWGDHPDDRQEKNAFGLVIATNTYHQEPLDTPGQYRGGDGGVRVHGGAHELESLVPLSSWFQNTAKPDQEDWWEHTLYRPIYSLPDSMFG